MPLKDDIAQLKEALAKGPARGEWYIDSGVSTRTAWAIRSGDRDVLRLDGSENCDLDQKHGDVEENLGFVEAVHPDRIERLVDAVEKMGEALKFYSDELMWLRARVEGRWDISFGNDNGEQARSALKELGLME